MATQLTQQSSSYDLLSQTARQSLRARVADAQGDIEAVAREVRARMDASDTGSANENLSHAEHAFFVAQLTYLEHLSKASEEAEQPQQQGFFSRMKARFGGSRATS